MKDPNDISRSYKMLSQCNQILVRAEYSDTPNGKEKAKKVLYSCASKRERKSAAKNFRGAAKERATAE